MVHVETAELATIEDVPELDELRKIHRQIVTLQRRINTVAVYDTSEVVVAKTPAPPPAPRPPSAPHDTFSLGQSASLITRSCSARPQPSPGRAVDGSPLIKRDFQLSFAKYAMSLKHT